MPFFGIFKKQIRKRTCSHCGTTMPGATSSDGKTWECPSCHNTVHESGSGNAPGISFSVSTETGPRDLITDKQKQFLIDLGETAPFRFKGEASERIDSLIGCFDSWLAACFRKRDILDRPDQRRLQIAMHKANLVARLPKYGGDLAENHRIDLQRFVKETLGSDIFLNMGPVGITKNAEALGLPPRKQKEKLVKFFCPHCNQKYEAPEETADSLLDCQACGKQVRIPRPTRGYFAPPSEAQLEDAELYGVEVLQGTHRGKLKEVLTAAASDRSRAPSTAAYEHYHKRKTARQIRETEQTISEITDRLNCPTLPERETQDLRRALQDAQDLREEIIEEERQRKEDDRQYAEEDKRWEVDMRALSLYEHEFSRGGDWSEFYRKPTRKQFDAVHAWLNTNKPGWAGIKDVIDAIDHLFPELKK